MDLQTNVMRISVNHPNVASVVPLQRKQLLIKAKGEGSAIVKLLFSDGATATCDATVAAR
jgi:Flp pilus assembly secretin CpaC